MPLFFQTSVRFFSWGFVIGTFVSAKAFPRDEQPSAVQFMRIMPDWLARRRSPNSAADAWSDLRFALEGGKAEIKRTNLYTSWS